MDGPRLWRGDVSKRVSRKVRLLMRALHLLYAVRPQAAVLAVAGSLATALAYPILLLLFKSILEAVSTLSQGREAAVASVILWPLGLLLAVVLTYRLVSVAKDASSLVLRQEASSSINAAVMRKMEEVPFEAFEDNDFQARYGLVIRDASAQSLTLVDALASAALGLIGMVGVAGGLLVIAPLPVLVLLAVSLPALLLESRFSRAMVQLQSLSAPGLLRMQILASLQIDARWQRDLRAYRSSVLVDEYADVAATYLRRLRRLVARYQGLRMAVSVLETAALGAAIAASLFLIATHRLSLIEAGVTLSGVAMLVVLAQAAGYGLRSLTEVTGYLEVLFEFIDRRFPLPANPRVRVTSAGPPALELHSLNYTYPSGRTALRDMSHRFETGLTAVVGPNGAGKTTLVKLLSGLITPTSGEIIASGFGRQPSYGDVLKSVLFQDPARFHLSIRQYVTMVQTAHPDQAQAVEAALRRAGLSEFVSSLPEGIDTVVGPGFGGFADLSGGQWQRLALARVIYQDWPIVILDEPSANLDAEGERAAFETFERISANKIIVFTTHRLDTVQCANNILVLIDGQLRQAGSHRDLLQQAGYYASLYPGKDALQSRGRQE